MTNRRSVRRGVQPKNSASRRRRGWKVALLAMSALALIASSCVEDAPPPSRLKVTAPSMTLEYGDAIPVLEATYNKVPDVEATCTTDATQSSAPGTYDVTCEGAAYKDRVVEYHDGTITIVPAPVTVTASSGTMAVGDEPPAITATYDGLKLGQTEPAILATCSTDATSASSAGTYTTSCTGADDDNYTFTYVDGTMEVEAALVTVTASSGSHTYGDDAPAISPQYSGFQHGETAPATDAVCESASDSSSPVGTYASTCSGAADPNYTFVYVDGTVEVTPAALTITASSASMLTGDAAPVITPSYSGLVNGETEPATPPTCSTTADSTSPAGVYPSSCSGAVDDNYAITYVDGEVTVNQSITPVVVTASSATVTYGDAIPEITADYDGMVGTPATPAVCTTTATQGSGVGTYETTCADADDPAHTFSYVDGTITIVPAAATITASSDSMTYGGSVPAITASYSGLVNGDTAPATPPTCSTDATSSSDAGSYTSTCADAADDNYTFSYVDGTVTIDQAEVTVTASDASFDEGDEVPEITASYSGFLFGEAGPATAPTCSTNATSSSPAGTYSSSCAGAADPNYTFSYVDGVVTVNEIAVVWEPETTGYAGYSTETVATSVAAGSDGVNLPSGNISVASVNEFDTYVNLTVVSSAGAQAIFCKGKSTSSNNPRFTGCEGGSGTISEGDMVTTGAQHNFNVATLFSSAVENSSLTILQDVPAAFRALPAQTDTDANFAIITSLITPSANGEFSLIFGICDAGTATFDAEDAACHVGELVYGAGGTAIMGAKVQVSIASSNVYQRLHSFNKAPATVEQDEVFTVYAGSSSTAVPKYQPSSIGDATVNNAKDIAIVFPIPEGMEFVGVDTQGGDRLSSGNIDFTYCEQAGDPGCVGKTTGNFDWTTYPYLQVSTASGFVINGGAVMTMPTIALTLKAVGAPGTVAHATMTQFNLTTSIKAPIIGNQTAKFEGYPTDDSNPSATPPKAPPAILGSIEIVGAGM